MKAGKKPKAKAAPVVDAATLVELSMAEMSENFAAIKKLRACRSTGRIERSIADLSRANENLARTIAILSPAEPAAAPVQITVSTQWDPPRETREAHLHHQDPAETVSGCVECNPSQATGN